MSKKRTIIVRHPQLVKFRNALRDVVFMAELVELRALREKKRGLEPTESDKDLKQMNFLSDRADKLDTAWKKSICTCSLCGSRMSDMTFNTYFNEWFCTVCYQKTQQFYEKKASEGETWYDNSLNRIPSTKWWP